MLTTETAARTAYSRLNRAMWMASSYTTDAELAEGRELFDREAAYAIERVEDICEAHDLDTAEAIAILHDLVMRNDDAAIFDYQSHFGAGKPWPLPVHPF